MNNQFYYEDGTVSDVPVKDKVLGRFGGPAVITKDSQEWFRHGRRHREDGPAVERKNGYKAYYINGELHNENGPAIIGADGSQSWYYNGLPHREGAPAMIYSDGAKYWYLKGKESRPDGPAVELPHGTTSWFIDGVRFVTLPRSVLQAYSNRVYGEWNIDKLLKDKDPVVRNSARLYL